MSPIERTSLCVSAYKFFNCFCRFTQALKSWLDTHIKTMITTTITSTKIMASGPITSWQIIGIKWKQWQILFSWVPKPLWTVTTAIKLKYNSWKKAVASLDSVLKSRHISLPTKVCIVKSMVFPIVMYECECWTIKKVECGRTDAFELWC